MSTGLGIFLDKLLFSLLGKLASKYIEKTFLTAKKRFQTSEKDLNIYQFKSLELMKNVGLRPANSRTATEQAINEITFSIVNLFNQDLTADERKFGINFLDYYTDDMTIKELLIALKNLDPRCLASIISSICNELISDQSVHLISSRDALQGINKKIEGECCVYLKSANLLVNYLQNIEDNTKYIAPSSNESKLIFGGIDPDINSNSTLFHEMRNIQKEMKLVGKLTARQKCSRTHIVMSSIIGEGWLNKEKSEEKYMVITGGKTDKSELLIPSQTPIIKKVGNTYIYYGDESCKPSSELLSHWSMHERLSKEGENYSNLKCIFHAHLVDIISFSNNNINKSQLKINGDLVPNIDWQLHGTSKLGEEIISAVTHLKSRMAIIKNHGPWFFAESMKDAFDYSMNTIQLIKFGN
jgi:ribulose-5-phosphate 4-epimerase/fuculose-1-phosphate aldolase